MAENKCPYCNKCHCVPDVAFANADNYGSQYYRTVCKYCGGAIIIYLTRRVELSSIDKGTHTEDDFGREVKETKKLPPLKMLKKIVPRSGKKTKVHLYS